MTEEEMEHPPVNLPKVELHTHIEGAAQPDFVRQLAFEKKTDISGIFDERGAYKYQGFLEFLQVYEAATTVLKSPEDFRRLTLSVLENAAENGVIYMESFLSPEFCGGADVGAWTEYLHAIQDGAAEAEKKYGIGMRGVVTCIRHFGPEKAKLSAICAAETAGDFVTGFGMGGDENAGHQRDFLWAYDCAREAGLGLTTHAGEWRGPQEVRDAIDDLKVTRIGHGVRCIEDMRLVEHLAEREITLEVCPGSNVALGVYPDLKSHPIERLRAYGVKVTVSTDDPPFFHTTMQQEYAGLTKTFGWYNRHFKEITLNAVAAAFCDQATKDALTKRLEDAF